MQNYPLYIRSTPTENELKFHYMVHTSLDVVDEKISAMGKALVDQRELYLGLLYPTEDYKVYPPLQSQPRSYTPRAGAGRKGWQRKCKGSQPVRQAADANRGLQTFPPLIGRVAGKNRAKGSGACTLT